MPPASRSCRRGFTLVELLVVIVILALLAAISVPAIFSAIGRAKELKITAEMKGMLSQLELMRQRFGAFPPSTAPADATDPNDPAVRYILRMSPLTTDPAVELAAFDADGKALVFWLSGVSPDSGKPMTGGNKDLAFEFDTNRLDNAALTYRPPIESISSPYVYQRNSEQKATITHVGLDDVAGGDDALSVGN